MIDRDAFERLLEKGRRHGGLTTEDLRAALPIERMGADEIALLVVQIEEEGVAVDIDEELLARSGAAARTPPPAVPVINLPGSGRPWRSALESADAPGLAPPARAPAKPAPNVAPAARASWAFIVLAAAIVAALALAAVLIVR